MVFGWSSVTVVCVTLVSGASPGDSGAAIVEHVSPWAPIERREAGGLSYEEFRTRYKERQIPVIITNYTDDWPIMDWSFERLKEECQSDPIDFLDKSLHLIQALPPVAREQWERELKHVFGTGFQEFISKAAQGMSTGEFIDYVTEERSPAEISRQSFWHLVHYLLPLHMHSYPLHRFCSQKLVKDVTVPRYLLGRYIGKWCENPKDRGPVYGGVFDPEIFFASNHSRSYPAHLHGISADILLLVVRGKKQYVGWHYNEQDNLYRFNMGTAADHTETSDEIFLAEGIRPDFELQPILKGAKGWSGLVEEGELLYIPCGHVHQIENLAPTFSLTFRTLDEDVIQCSRKLKELGARTLEMTFLEDIQENVEQWDSPSDLSFREIHNRLCPNTPYWTP